MNKIEVKTYRDQIGHQKYLFQIPLDNGYAYMTLNKSFLRDSKHGGPEKLVIVDTNKFLELWKNSTRQCQKRLALGNEKVWRKDYKFHHAEKGFSFGPKNPVPLAYLHCYSYEVKKSRVIFIITSVCPPIHMNGRLYVN